MQSGATLLRAGLACYMHEDENAGEVAGVFVRTEHREVPQAPPMEPLAITGPVG
jgi:hypothetical protein